MERHSADRSARRSIRERITGFVQSVTRGGQISRRRTTIEILRTELESEREWLGEWGGESYETYYYDRALELLDEAADALDDDDPVSSRRAYYSAQRMAVLGLADPDAAFRGSAVSRADSGDESHGQAPDARSEATDPRLSAYRRFLLRTKTNVAYVQAADRLSGWQRRLVDDRLTSDGEIRDDIDVTELVSALDALQAYHVTHDLVFGKLKRQLNYFVGFASLTILAVFLSVQHDVFGPVLSATVDMNADRFLFYVVLFGVLGASVNAIFSLSRRFVRGQIVETRELFDFPMALARVVAGGISALVLFVVFQAGFFEAVFRFDFGPGLALSLALAAGFSEELVRNALDQLSGRVIGSGEHS
jgi:hypothetical protein